MFKEGSPSAVAGFQGYIVNNVIIETIKSLLLLFVKYIKIFPQISLQIQLGTLVAEF